MEIVIKTGKLENVRTNLLAVFLLQESRHVEGWLKQLDKLSRGRITSLLKTHDFKGEMNECALIYMPENANIKRVLFVGLGKKKEFTIERALQAFGTAAKTAAGKKIRRFTLSLCGMEVSGISKLDLAHAAAEGAILSLYKFTEYKTEDSEKNQDVKQIYIFNTRRLDLEEMRSGTNRGEAIAHGVCYARDLASHPGNVVTPAYLAQEAEKIAKENGLKCTIFGPDILREKRINALLAVAQGSHVEPRMIMLEYECGVKNAETVALVGKGLTFDAGGISIKPAKKMEEMKYDMCGAAALLGYMKIIKRLNPKLNVVAVIGSAENLPGGGAMKPGDIIKTYSGITVEVINTDAEGRLVLADALAYTADTYKPDAMIDLATLTGAVIVALGHYATGMLGSHQSLLKKIKAAGDKSGETVWELPIYPEFDEHIKSDTADIKNSDGPGAGTIFGAVFLQRFVGKVPWVHLDIAGTAWDVKEKSYLPKGPTGVGVRLLSQLLEEW
ncbi:leucyl aminopeptidase [candidate division KSB1 bacterium]